MGDSCLHVMLRVPQLEVAALTAREHEAGAGLRRHVRHAPPVAAPLPLHAAPACIRPYKYCKSIWGKAETPSHCSAQDIQQFIIIIERQVRPEMTAIMV